MRSLEYIFNSIASHTDRNSISLICKSWHKIERFSRRNVFIGNCYSITPSQIDTEIPISHIINPQREPHFADFPQEWGGLLHPWIHALASAGVWLEKLRLKRMVVNDESLELLSRSFANFKSLELVLDRIADHSLDVVASTCKDLQELRVFPSNTAIEVTEVGLVAISAGCLKLRSILYFCKQMTNAALITVAKNCPNLNRFRLCIREPKKPDHLTSESLDEGFGAIVQACKGLRRLSVSGLLTDKVFLYIGMYTEQLEMLSVACAGDTDNGMLYVLNGCKKLKKLEIRDCPFGNAALLADVDKYEKLRSLWMSSCEVTLGGCKKLAQNVPWLNVEIINENDNNRTERNEEDETEKVDKLYLYRTVAGKRKDAPPFVKIL